MATLPHFECGVRNHTVGSTPTRPVNARLPKLDKWPCLQNRCCVGSSPTASFMNTKPLLFNRNPIYTWKSIPQPSNELVKNTLSLWNCSVEDAIKYGGDLTKAAIGAMNIRNDKKYVVVDTKVHMLMKGMYPAIPGWHTDGVPRGINNDPQAKEPPNIWLQEKMQSPRFHLLVTGEGCLTDFFVDPIALDVPEEPTTELYKLVSDQCNKIFSIPTVLRKVTIPSCRVVEWDWWNLHTAVPAKQYEWRFLIRVTETDYQQPEVDLRKIIRTQQNVYVPESFGW